MRVGRTIRRRLSPLVAAGALLTALATPAALHAAAWQTPTAQEVRTQVLQWLDGQKADPALAAEVRRLWENTPDSLTGSELLGRLAESFARVDPRVRQLVDGCAQPHRPGPLPPYAWLGDAKTPPLVAKNMRLYYGCYLVRQSLLEEALEQFRGLRPGDVVDPASLLFYEMVAHHGLVHCEEGLQAAEQLLQDESHAPKRYLALARLTQEDLKNVREETLDHIARRMDDIHRRLDLGRAGPKVRTEEDGVIKSLDDLIKKIEQQQQQQPSAGANSLQPRKAADESRLMGGKGRGEVTQKNVGAKSGWGELPPKQREEAMQQIGRDFPSHYREIIEQYFKKLASEE
jgi:hypothetical protein